MILIFIPTQKSINDYHYQVNWYIIPIPIITGRRKEKIEANARNIIKQYRIAVIVVIVDLSNENGLNKLLEIIKDKERDVLVNNAGFGLKPYFATY